MPFPDDLAIRFATAATAPTILGFIRELAEYEKLAHEVVADEAQLRATLFGARPAAEVLIAELGGAPVGFALFFQSYSTFLGKPGLYLEDLFVQPAARGQGVGRALMSALARIAVAARLRPLRVVGARLERARARVLRRARRRAADRVDGAAADRRAAGVARRALATPDPAVNARN